MPACTGPAGMPIGVLLVGERNKDGELLKIADWAWQEFTGGVRCLPASANRSKLFGKHFTRLTNHFHYGVRSCSFLLQRCNPSTYCESVAEEVMREIRRQASVRAARRKVRGHSTGDANQSIVPSPIKVGVFFKALLLWLMAKGLQMLT